MGMQFMRTIGAEVARQTRGQFRSPAVSGPIGEIEIGQAICSCLSGFEPHLPYLTGGRLLFQALAVINQAPRRRHACKNLPRSKRLAPFSREKLIV